MVLVTCKALENHHVDHILTHCNYFNSVLLAVAIPKIDLVISLVGAVSGTFLVILGLLITKVFVVLSISLSQALIFPPILEYLTYAPNISKLTLAKEIVILIFGAIAFATGTYAAVLAIVQEFSD